MKKESYFKNSYNIFIDSFKKIDIKIFFIVFFDLAFYALAFLISITTFRTITNKAVAIDLSQDPLQAGAEKLLAELSGFYFLLIAMLFLMILIIIVNWSILKGLVWGLTTKRKFNFKFFLRFFLVNLVWLGTFTILIFSIAFSFREEVLPIYMLILLLIWAYFTNIIYTLFMKNTKKAVRKAFKLGFTKIHYFILPYLVLLLIFLIVYLMMYLTTFLPQGIGIAIIASMLLFYFAWARFYIVNIIESL